MTHACVIRFIHNMTALQYCAWPRRPSPPVAFIQNFNATTLQSKLVSAAGLCTQSEPAATSNLDTWSPPPVRFQTEKFDLLSPLVVDAAQEEDANGSYVHIYKNTNIYIEVKVYTYLYRDIYIYMVRSPVIKIQTHTQTFTYTHTYMHTCTHTYTCTHTRMRTDTNTDTHKHICTYTHTHTQAL